MLTRTNEYMCNMSLSCFTRLDLLNKLPDYLHISPRPYLVADVLADVHVRHCHSELHLDRHLVPLAVSFCIVQDSCVW